MDAQNTNMPADATPEITAALIDLARLSWRAASMAASDTDATHTIALALLDQLLRLCGAQSGTVLSSPYMTTTHEQFAVLSPSKSMLFRPVALHGMNEEEALALLATFSLEGMAIQTPPGELPWVICRFPMPAYPGYGQDKGTESSVGAAGSQTGFPFLAFLVLGWTGTNNGTGAVPIEKGYKLLPLVADAVNSVLANLLVTEHVRELEALADRKALREMGLLKAETLASVSHELRSPLASIKGYAATLLRHERRISREERHEFLVAINEGSDRLAGVIEHLLEMSQLETDMVGMEYTTVNLAHLVREALMAVEQRLGRPEQLEASSQTSGQVTFTLRLEDRYGMLTGDEPLIRADRYRLREVLDNLLENALYYSPGGGAIEVVVRSSTARDQVGRERTPTSSGEDNRNGKKSDSPSFMQGDRQMVEIRVHDSGIGIPQEHLERIFDRFHRVDTRLTREVNGLGLGLAICKRIVELHNGVIWAESEVGQGSTFHVLLPMNGWP